MDKKNQQSKAQFGTLTAKSDANNDYDSKHKTAQFLTLLTAAWQNTAQ